jgi:hypothetical protein
LERCLVFIGFIFFLVAVASAPIDFFWPWPGLLGLRLLLVGGGLIFASWALSPRERSFMQATTRYAIFCFVFLALWMLMQLVPFKPFAHPFWGSAGAALNLPLAGTISVDIGATFLAFTRINLAAALLLLGAALALDRTRAEWVLVGLTAVSGLLLASLLFGVILPDWLGLSVREDLGDDIFTFASLALILAVTTANFVFERFETRRGSQMRPALRLVVQEAVCAFIVLAAILVLLQSPHPAVLFVAISGVCAPLVLILVRRLGLGPFAGTAAALIPLMASVVIAGATHVHTSDLMLTYSSAADDQLELSHRMASDAPWAGTGAATSESLRPLYQSLEGPKEAPLASTAAIVTIELGRFVFWLIALLTFVSFVRLVHGALLRGRDSFYPAAGAGCLYAILLGVFVNAGFLAAPNYLFAGAILGMALAQSASRA